MCPRHAVVAPRKLPQPLCTERGSSSRNCSCAKGIYPRAPRNAPQWYGWPSIETRITEVDCLQGHWLVRGQMRPVISKSSRWRSFSSGSENSSMGRKWSPAAAAASRKSKFAL